MARMMVLFVAAFWETLFARLRRGPARPSWGLMFEWTVTFLRNDFRGTEGWDYPRLRRELDGRVYPSKVKHLVTFEERALGAIGATRCTPRAGAAQGKVLLYLHGGSYIFGGAKSHADLVARLALATKLVTVVPDYRLAPEHPYPAQLDDALAAWDALLAEGFSPSDVAVAGDSAGGHLALALALALRDAGRPLPSASVLISPWLDLEQTRPSSLANDSVDYGTRRMLLAQAKAVAGPRTPREISLIDAKLDGLGRTLVVVGDAERLYDEGAELVARARREGLPFTLETLRDMPHNGPIFAAYHPEGARAIEVIGAFLGAPS